MHIPDGFLSTPVWATFDALSVPAVGIMARRAQGNMEDGRIPLLGVMGAFVFAAQMINFPVGPGTSGHLVGGTLLAIALGPAAASIVMTAILMIQAFVFQDGGIVALGANVFNMAVVGVFAGYLPYMVWGKSKGRTAAIFAGGVISVVSSACLALSQLLISGVTMPREVLWVSIGLFVVSGLIEGAITVSAVSAIERLNPMWVRNPRKPGSRILGTLAIAAVVLAAVSVLLASAAPDGIEKLLADYQLPGDSKPWFSKSVAGLAGLAMIYLSCIVTGRVLARRRA